MSTEVEDGQTLATHISGLITVGWRKGVDGEGSALMYNTLNPGCFSDNQTIKAISNRHCEMIGEAVAPLVTSKASKQEIAKMMKETASIPPAVPYVGKRMTPLGEGRAMFRALLPIEFESYGKRRLVAEPRDEYGRISESEQRVEENGWAYRCSVKEETLEALGLVLIKLVQEIPAVREYFEQPGMNVFIDTESEYRQRLSEAVAQVTDDGWESLAGWVLYCLGVEEG